MGFASWLESRRKDRRAKESWAGRIHVHRRNSWGWSLGEDHAFGLPLRPGLIVARITDAGVMCREILTVRHCRDPPDMMFYTYRPIDGEEATAHIDEVRAAIGQPQGTQFSVCGCGGGIVCPFHTPPILNQENPA